MTRIIKLLLYYFAYQLAFSGVFTIGYMLVCGLNRMPMVSDPGFMSVSIAAQVLATIGIGIHLVWGKYASLQGRVRSVRPVLLYLAAAVFIVSMGCWTNYVNELLHLPDNMGEVLDAMLNHPLGIFSIVVLAPVVEELLFRGGIQGYLVRHWQHPARSIVVSSLIFGAVHGNPVQIPFAFVTGLALGWMYYRSGSLWPGIWMHFLNNGSSVLLYHLADNPDATVQEMLGSAPALALAVGGLAATVACIWLIRQKLTLQPPTGALE